MKTVSRLIAVALAVASLSALSILPHVFSTLFAERVLSGGLANAGMPERPMDVAMTTMKACYERSFNRLGTPTTDLATLERVSAFCYQESGYAYLLTEWEVRRRTFLQQQDQASEVLKMVVGLTWAGVALSAAQLAMAFLLSWRQRKNLSDSAEAKDSTELKVKSQVTCPQQTGPVRT